MESPVSVGDRLLHSQHVTSLLDSVRDATLMLCGKACVFSRKNLSCLGDETGKKLRIVECVIHRVAGAVKCFFVGAHRSVER